MLGEDLEADANTNPLPRYGTSMEECSGGGVLRYFCQSCIYFTVWVAAEFATYHQVWGRISPTVGGKSYILLLHRHVWPNERIQGSHKSNDHRLNGYTVTICFTNDVHTQPRADPQKKCGWDGNSADLRHQGTSLSQ